VSLAKLGQASSLVLEFRLAWQGCSDGVFEAAPCFRWVILIPNHRDHMVRVEVRMLLVLLIAKDVFSARVDNRLTEPFCKPGFPIGSSIPVGEIAHHESRRADHGTPFGATSR
jgi:hypothetical protein